VDEVLAKKAGGMRIAQNVALLNCMQQHEPLLVLKQRSSVPPFRPDSRALLLAMPPFYRSPMSVSPRVLCGKYVPLT